MHGAEARAQFTKCDVQKLLEGLHFRKSDVHGAEARAKLVSKNSIDTLNFEQAAIAQVCDTHSVMHIFRVWGGLYLLFAVC